MITILYFLIFIAASYLPVIRIGGIPLLISDIILFFVFVISILYTPRKIYTEKVSLYFLIPVFWGVGIVIARGIYGPFSLKELILPIIHLKMFMFVYASIVLWRKINFERLIKLIIISLIVQLLIATLQKFGIPGFSSGFFYKIAVNNAMSNVYYGGNLPHIIATHLNVTFRPIGLIGSPTILASFFVIIFYLLSLYNKNKLVKPIIYYSLLLCFSKVTLFSFFIYNNIITPILRRNIKDLIISIVASIVVILIFILFISYNDRMYNYFMLFINGDDYGVTHRISVIDFMTSLDGFSILFGVGGEPQFIFDSGFLLTIFRFGIIYLIILYYVYYKVFSIFSYKYSHVFLMIMYLFADLTIGSFHNQMFFYLIGFSLIYSRYILLNYSEDKT